MQCDGGDGGDGAPREALETVLATGCGDYRQLGETSEIDAVDASRVVNAIPNKTLSKKDLRLVFEATQSQPDFAKLFLATGGSINSAAGQDETDVSLTAGASCAFAVLSPDEPTQFHMTLPSAMIYEQDDDGNVVLNSDIKLNVNSNRMGSAINGVVVSTHAGAASIHLSHLLSKKNTHAQLPCTYGTLLSHACTLGLSNIRVLNNLDEEVDIEFRKDEAAASISAKAEKVVDEWANAAWNLRQTVKYKLSPTLTKSVAKVPVGVNGSGFSLVHDVIDQEFPFSKATLNSLFESAIGMELEFNEESMAQLRTSTAQPGLRSALWAQTIAGATSTAVNYLMAYRADGRTVIGAQGSGFTAAESWLRTPMRTPCEANDCDGSGLVAVSMIQAAIDADEDELKTYPFLQVVKNVVHPYYQTGITVVGATAAQADGADATGQTVAGHALVLMMPTLALLDGLHKGAADHTVAGKKLASDPSELARLRRTAIFSEAVLDSLPSEEAATLRSGNVANWESAKRLQPYAIEGTTPASPILYIVDSKKRSDVADGVKRDQKAFAAAAPTVARGLKVLHVGGHGDGHLFYHDFVELSFHPSNPLYADEKLRDIGHAASQFVFGVTNSVDIKEAGASPKQLVLNDYAVVPMHTIDTVRGKLLDFSGSLSRADVLPPRSESMQLSVKQTANLKRSLAALKLLSDHLPDSHDTGHCVAYVITFSALTNNPQSVEHFVARVSDTSVAGVVDLSIIDDLAVDADGKPAGVFAVVNTVVQI